MRKEVFYLTLKQCEQFASDPIDAILFDRVINDAIHEFPVSEHYMKGFTLSASCPVAKAFALQYGIESRYMECLK